MLPGLINGHLHTWQSALRGIAGDWTVARYMQAMHRGLATLYRPEDIYIANLMGALNQINGGGGLYYPSDPPAGSEGQTQVPQPWTLIPGSWIQHTN